MVVAELALWRSGGTALLGPGAVAELGRVASELGGEGPILLCTDPFLAEASQAKLATASLRAAGFEVKVHADAVPELPRAVVEAAIERAQEVGPSCLVALGGGSCIDLAKLIALGLAHDGPLESFYGENQVPGATLPVIAVPTTGGTGSEVTPVAVLTDPAVELKVGISSPHLIPTAAICDPELTMGAPKAVSAYAGIDALAHAIEAFSAVRREDWSDIGGRVFVGANSLTDGFALQATELISGSLLAAIDDDPGARTRMLEGSFRAGLAFGTAGTGAAHALQYPLGAATGTPHGLGVGLLLPFVMRFNRPVAGERLERIGAALGVGHDADLACSRVRELAIAAGVPASLGELGVAADDLDAMAVQAVGIKRLIDNNPRPVDVAAARSILTAAWSGDLDLVDRDPG
jgi:alcohol dehydrogenase class IV